MECRGFCNVSLELSPGVGIRILKYVLVCFLKSWKLLSRKDWDWTLQFVHCTNCSEQFLSLLRGTHNGHIRLTLDRFYRKKLHAQRHIFGIACVTFRARQISVCVCVCVRESVSVSVRERERERERDIWDNDGSWIRTSGPSRSLGAL